MIREMSRSIADNEIRPVAAEYDRTGEFPWPVVEKIAEADLFGVFIDEAYGGMAGDSPDHEHGAGHRGAVQGVRRHLARLRRDAPSARCRSSCRRPATKEAAVSAGDRHRRAPGGVRAHRAAGRVRRRRHPHHRGPRRRPLRGERHEAVDHERRGGRDLHRRRDDEPRAKGARGVERAVVEKDTPGFRFGKKEDKMGIRASSTRELDLRGLPRSGGEPDRPRGDRVHHRDEDVRCLPARGRQRRRSGSRRARSTWPWTTSISRRQFGSPVSSFQGLRFLLADMAMKVEASRAP